MRNDVISKGSRPFRVPFFHGWLALIIECMCINSRFVLLTSDMENWVKSYSLQTHTFCARIGESISSACQIIEGVNAVDTLTIYAISILAKLEI